jgi:hypothetical protein
MTDETDCSLFIIFARQAPRAVILRRGQDNWVQQILWDLKNDSFIEGQWFHGRVHERRCDLSPDGRKLLYFAVGDPHELYDPAYSRSWTAVSNPPYFTPVAAWPKGDLLAGGGLFHDNTAIWLNHKQDRIKAHPQLEPPANIHVNFNQWATGEDYPLYAKRLERDGWTFKQFGDFRHRGGKWFVEKEEICVKPDPLTRRFELKMILKGVGGDRGKGPFEYLFTVRDQVTNDETEIDADTFADWDCRGRLAYSRRGKLYAGEVLPQARLDMDQLADFSNNSQVLVSEPEQARVW